jgi:hypothetical protein
MAYTLIMLAPGSYDVTLNGVIVASLVRSVLTNNGWSAELLSDLPPEERPPPFVDLEHEFTDFDEVCRWLDNPEIAPAR